MKSAISILVGVLTTKGKVSILPVEYPLSNYYMYAVDFVHFQVKTTLVMSIIAACTTSYCVSMAIVDVVDVSYHYSARPVWQMC